MERKFNYVYITTNMLNSKQYVGSHATDNIDDGYLGSGTYFFNSVKKYGKENFKREFLEECSDILEARKLEGFYIEKYNTLRPNGYNISPKGGIGFMGAVHSKETKLKQSLSAKNKNPEKCSMFGKHHSEETRLKMSESAKIRNPNMLGKHHSEETRLKMREKAIGRKLSDEIKNKISNTLKGNQNAKNNKTN